MATEWKSGDLVKLKSGGPLMTVESRYAQSSNGYYCSWFDKEDKRIREVFNGNAIEEATKEENVTIDVKFI